MMDEKKEQLEKVRRAFRNPYLWEFFNDMNRWEQMAEQKGRGDQAEVDALFARRVSWSPRSGWRPVNLSWRSGGTYAGELEDVFAEIK